MYRELLRSMPVAVYFKDVDTNFVDVNTFHAEAIGRPSNELIGLSDQDIYPETEAELYYGADRRVIDEGATIDGLIENNSGFQGTVVQNATSKFPVRNASGDIVGMMGFAIDVASSSGALEKLKESELRYALAMRATSEGIWDYDVAADSSSISPRGSPTTEPADHRGLDSYARRCQHSRSGRFRDASQRARRAGSRAPGNLRMCHHHHHRRSTTLATTQVCLLH